MKQMYLLLLAMIAGVSSYAGTYYYNGSGTITSTASWGTNQDGSGASPSNFVTSGDVFWVANTSSTITLTASWTITGVTLHIGSGTTATINGNYWYPTVATTSSNQISGTGAITVEKGAGLKLAGTTVPTFSSTQSDSSFVEIAASATIPSGVSFGYLKISGGSPKCSTGSTTVQNDLSISAGTLTVASSAATYKLYISRNFVISGTGALVMASVASATCIDTVFVSGDFSCSGTASSAGTGATTQTLVNFQSASGVPSTSILLVNGDVTNTATATNFLDWGRTNSGTTTNSALIVRGDLNNGGASRFYYYGNGLGGYVKFAGTTQQIFTYSSTYPSGTSAGSGSNTQYVNFQVLNGAYVKLSGSLPLATPTGQYSSFYVLSGGTLDMGSSATITGGSTNGGFAVYAGGTLLTGNAGGISSSITATLNSATGISTGGFYGFNGSVSQVTSTRLPTSVKKLIIDNTSGVTLSRSTSCDTLSFTSGKLNTSNYTQTVTTAVRGASTSSYVNTDYSSGALVKPITGLTTVTFEVGDTSYAPVTLSLSSAGTGGSFSVSSRNGQHPNYATSCFANSAYDSHYWILSSIAASGPTTVTPRFDYNYADIVGGTNSGFVGQRYASGTWSGGLTTTNGTSPYYSSLAATALASLPGDYQFSPFVPTVNGSPASLTFSPTLVGYSSATLTTDILACSLTPSSGYLTVTAPTNFKVFNGTGWVTSYTIAYTGGSISSPETIPVQFNPVVPGYSTGVITISGGGLSTPATIAVAGNSPAVYYSQATGFLDDLNTWGVNADGSGAHPGTFGGGDTFIVKNNSTATINSHWNVSSSYFYVGNDTNAIQFTVPAAYTVTGIINVTANATLKVTNASVPTLGSLSPTSTVILNGSSAQTIPVATYGNFKYSGTSTANHQAGTTNVLGDYTISSGIVYIAQTAITDSIIVSGNFILDGTGALVMANAAGTSCKPTVMIAGNLTSTSTAATVMQWHAASGAAPVAVMQVNGNVSDNNTGGSDANFIDWGNATALGTSSYLGIGGNLSLAGRNRMYLLGNYSAYGVVFNGSGTSSSPQTFYWNQTHALAVSNGYCNYTVNPGTYVKMISNMRMGTNTGNVNWQYIFRVKSGGTLDCDTFTISDGNSNGSNGFQVEAGGTLICGHASGVSGNITAALSTGTGLSTSANYVFNGPSSQITGTRLPSTVNKLTVNNGHGVTLTNSIVADTLEFASGILFTSTNTIKVNEHVAGAGATTYVNANGTGGALIKPVASVSALTFEIGDSSYAPVNLTLSSAGTSGTFGAKVTYGAHPNFPYASVSSLAFAKHYWSLTNNSVAGPATVIPKFNYNSADIVGGSNDSFYAKKYVSGSWYPTGTVTNSTSPTFTSVAGGINLASLQGDYQVGDSSNPRFTYYSQSSGYLNDLTTWGVNTDGSGAHPVSFTNSGDSFIVVNNASPTINATWVVSGTIVQVGDGSSAVTLTVPSAYDITGSGSVVSIEANSSLILNNNTLPNLGALSATSTLTYNGTSSITLPAISYGSINFNGTGATHASGTTTVAGSYNINSGTVSIPSSAAISVSSGINVLGSATLNIGTTSLPSLGTVSDTSTIILSASGAVTIPARSFGNLSYTGSGTAAHSSGTTNIHGNYTITTGKVTFAPTATTYTCNIGGNMTISGTGAVVMSGVASGSSVANVTVSGNLYTSTTATANGTAQNTNTVINFQPTSGTPSVGILQVNGSIYNTSIASNFLDWGNTSSGTTNTSYIGVKGDFSYGGAGRFYYYGNGLGGYVKFNGSSPQTFTYSSTYPSGTYGGSGSGIQYCNFIVNSGAYVNISGNLPLGTSGSQYSLFSIQNGGTVDFGASGVISSGSSAGGFQVLSGGTIITANSGGFPASITATLNSTTGYGAGAKYIFNGSTTTPFAAAISSNAPAEVRVNSGTVKANYAFSPSTSLVVDSSAVLDMDNLTLAGAFTPTMNGVLRTQANGATPIPSGLTWGGTIELYAAIGAQTLVSGTYNNLTNSNLSGTNSLASGASVVVNGDLTLNSGSNLSDNGNIITLAGNFYGTGSHTSVSSGRINMTGANKTISGVKVGRLYHNNSGITTLTGNPTVNDELNMVSGNIKLGSSYLQLGVNATVSGGSSTSMILADASGAVRQLVNSAVSAGLRSYAIGDSTGNYTPAQVYLNSGTYGAAAYLDINLRSAGHPNNANTIDYLKRYWSIRTSLFNANSFTAYGKYVAADVVGAASNISAGEYHGALPWVRTNFVDTVNNKVYTNGITDSVVDITGIKSANPILNVSPTSGTFCLGGSVGFTASGSGDATLTYSWAPATGLSSTTGTTVTATPTIAGTTVYTVTLTDGNGIAAVQTLTVTASATPTLSLGANPSVCQPATTASISYTSSGSPAAYDLVWDSTAHAAGFTDVIAGSFSGSSITLSLPPSATGAFYGSVVAYNGTCSSAVNNFHVTIYQQPIATITSAVAPCVGHATNIQITGTPGSTISYQVDGGSYSTATIPGVGVYDLSTGVITGSHSYTLHQAYNPACANTYDTTVVLGPIPMQWVGGTTGAEHAWNIAANWSCGFVPGATDNVSIPITANYPAVGSASTVYSNELIVDSGAFVSLGYGAVLHVKGDLINNGAIAGEGTMVLDGSVAQNILGRGVVGTLELNNSLGAVVDTDALLTVDSSLIITNGALTTHDSLVINAGVGFTARVAAMGATGSIAGQAKVAQYISGGYRRYRFWGHPFSAAIPLSQAEQSIDITGAGGASNGFTATSTNAPSAYRYNTLAGNSTLSYDPGWRPFTSAMATAADSNKIGRYQGIRIYIRGAKGEGLGYTPYTPSATVITQWGVLNQGRQLISLLKGTGTGQDYNLLSNPYASPVDIGTVLFNAKAAGNIVGGYYVWNPSLGSGGQFVPIPIGTTSATPYLIQANAAFEVRAAHAGDTIVFNESDKGTTATANLLRTTQAYTTLTIYDNDNHPWDALNIKFDDNAESTQDNVNDVDKLLGGDLNWYSLSSDGKRQAIDVRPLAFDKPIELGILSQVTGEFVIKTDNLQIPEGTTLYLHDRLLDTYTPMNQGAAYAFSITKDATTQGNKRFELAFSQPTQAQMDLSCWVFPNPASENVSITYKSNGSAPVKMSIRDLNGVAVLSRDLGTQTNGNCIVQLGKLASGVYMLELTSGSSTVVKRIVKE